MREKEPDCYRDPRHNEPGDPSEEWESDGTGGKVRVSHYRDGSSAVHRGGMGGTAHYDKYGREC